MIEVLVDYGSGKERLWLNWDNVVSMVRVGGDGRPMTEIRTLAGPVLAYNPVSELRERLQSLGVKGAVSPWLEGV